SDGGTFWTATGPTRSCGAGGSDVCPAVLTDPAGNSATSNAISVIVDNTAPTAGTLSFTGLTDSGSLDSPTPITTDGTFTLNLAGDLDANGVSVAYEVSTDGGTTWTATGSTQTGRAHV